MKKKVTLEAIWKYKDLKTWKLKLIYLTATFMESFHFGDNLRKIRTKKGISQDSVAKKLNYSQTTYWRMEARQHLPKNEVIYIIAEHLKVPVEQITPKWWNPELEIIQKQRKAFEITRVGHVLYILLLLGLLYEICRDIKESPWTVVIRIAVALSFAGVYFLTVKRIKEI